MFLKKKALLATVPSDSHSWNMVFIEFFLEENGYSVRNLGPNTPIEEVEETLHAEWFDLVVVSSVNGHAYIEGQALAKRITANSDYQGPLLLGGKICTQTDPETILRHSTALEKSGFDAVFDDSITNSFDSFQAFLAPQAFNIAEQPQQNQFATAGA